MKLITAIFLMLALVGCKSVTLHYGDKENPQRVTSVTGLDSSDAARVMNTSSYHSALKNIPQKAIVTIKGVPGQNVTISNRAEFTVWAPSTSADYVAPPSTKSEFAENVEAVGNATSNVLGAALPVVGIVQAGKALKSGFDAAGKDPVQVQTQIVEPQIVEPTVIRVP